LFKFIKNRKRFALKISRDVDFVGVDVKEFSFIFSFASKISIEPKF